MKHTVYYIENDLNFKGYIGVTRQALEKRFAQHVCDAKRERTDSTIHKAIRKYGCSNFTIVPLDVAHTREKALELEKQWILKLDTCHGPGYNDDEGGGDPPRLRGETHHASSLSEGDVFSMREKYARNPHTSYGKLALEYNIDRSSVAAIVNGDSWSHVPMPEGVEEAKGETAIKKSRKGGSNGSSDLTEEDAVQLRHKYEGGGYTQNELATEYEISQGHVTKIVNGKAWNEAGGPIQ